MKKVYIANMREGAKVDDVFLVSSKTLASTRNGSPYLRFKLCDKTGEVDAVKWDASEYEITKLGEDEYVLIQGTVNTYRDNHQITLDSIQIYDKSVDPSDFLRCTPKDPDKMFAELNSILRKIKNPHLSKLLDSIFMRDGFAQLFREAPAAKSVHHAYIGGLLEHTLNVVQGCIALADLYPRVDRDLLITAATLHDIGKIEEYTWVGSIKISDEGHLVGHIVSGAMLVKETADTIDGFDPMLSVTLQHMILSHHGQREFGSPKLPKSVEALILHTADDLDAKVAMFNQAIDESDSTGLFTKKHFLLDRPIFKGLPKIEKEKEQEPVEVNAGDELDLGLFAVDTDYDPFAED